MEQGARATATDTSTASVVEHRRWRGQRGAREVAYSSSSRTSMNSAATAGASCLSATNGYSSDAGRSPSAGSLFLQCGSIVITKPISCAQPPNPAKASCNRHQHGQTHGREMRLGTARTSWYVGHVQQPTAHPGSTAAPHAPCPPRQPAAPRIPLAALAPAPSALAASAASPPCPGT